MTLETLQAARIAAMKNNDAATKSVLSGMIDAVQKAAITPKGRVEITEQLTNETLIKYQKAIQEQVDTCPLHRTDLLTKYMAELNIVKMYAPQLITDKQVIKNRVMELASAAGLSITKQEKGAIMKLASAEFKGKADMKTVNLTVMEMLA